MKYHGKASHASAYPWEGVNALDAAVLAYNNLSALRQQLKPEWRLHGEPGTAITVNSEQHTSKCIHFQTVMDEKSSAEVLSLAIFLGFSIDLISKNVK